MMHLQRQGGSRLHFQPFHLEARTVLDAVVAAPGTENLAMQRVLVATLLLEPENVLLHVLHTVFWCDEDSILGLDHHVILQTYYRHEPALRVQIAAAGVLGNDIAPGNVAPAIRFGCPMERRPRAYVAPSRI